MNINIEKEYKVMVSKEQFDKLVGFYPETIFKKQVNFYYDTADFKIESLHGAMRIREKNNSYLFTMKIGNGKDLLEFETAVDRNDTTIFEEPAIKELLHSYGIHGPFHSLTSLCTFRGIYRTDNAELCFDKNYYNGMQDYEIEYEYKQEHDGLAEFQKILKRIHVTYHKNCTSKIQRALESLR